MKSVEDNVASTEINIRRLGEKFADVSNAVEKNSEIVNELSKNLSEEFKKLQTVTEENKSALQTGVKLAGVVGQLLKAPPSVKNLETLQKSSENISAAMDELKNSFAEFRTENSELTKTVGEILNQNTSVVTAANSVETATQGSVENFREVGRQIVTGTENLTTMFDDVRKELATLTKKLDAYNGLTRATLEQYSNLTEQDVRILEKISEKINPGRK